MILKLISQEIITGKAREPGKGRHFLSTTSGNPQESFTVTAKATVWESSSSDNKKRNADILKKEENNRRFNNVAAYVCDPWKNVSQRGEGPGGNQSKVLTTKKGLSHGRDRLTRGRKLQAALIWLLNARRVIRKLWSWLSGTLLEENGIFISEIYEFERRKVWPPPPPLSRKRSPPDFPRKKIRKQIVVKETASHTFQEEGAAMKPSAHQ